MSKLTCETKKGGKKEEVAVDQIAKNGISSGSRMNFVLGILAVAAVGSGTLGLIYHTWLGGFAIVLVFTLAICLVPVLARRDQQQ